MWRFRQTGRRGQKPARNARTFRGRSCLECLTNHVEAAQHSAFPHWGTCTWPSGALWSELPPAPESFPISSSAFGLNLSVLNVQELVAEPALLPHPPDEAEEQPGRERPTVTTAAATCGEAPFRMGWVPRPKRRPSSHSDPSPPSPPCPLEPVTVQNEKEKGQVQLMAYFKSDSLRFLSGTFTCPVPQAPWMEVRCSLWTYFEKLRGL